MSNRLPHVFGRGLRVAGVLLAGVGLSLAFLTLQRMRFADDLAAGKVSLAARAEDVPRITREIDNDIYRFVAYTLAALLSGTTCFGFGWSMGRHVRVPPERAVADTQARPPMKERSEPWPS